MRVLVCGGRDHRDRAMVWSVLSGLHRDEPITLIIHGACSIPDVRRPPGELSGADRWAEEWAVANEVDYVGCPARWRRSKNAAGPLRNQRMLDEHRPDYVLAFKGNDGTADMVAKARAAGVEVIVIDEDEAYRAAHPPQPPPAPGRGGGEMTRHSLSNDRLRVLLSDPKPPSCGNSCVLAKPQGMATNGPCHCLDDVPRPLRSHVQRMVLLGRHFDELAAEVLELRLGFNAGIEAAAALAREWEAGEPYLAALAALKVPT